MSLISTSPRASRRLAPTSLRQLASVMLAILIVLLTCRDSLAQSTGGASTQTQSAPNDDYTDTLPNTTKEGATFGKAGAPPCCGSALCLHACIVDGLLQLL